jgi:dCMP deaminase
MKKQKYMTWHSYFMSVALLSSFRSKDNKTQNGACIVDPNNKVIGIGYNGLPAGCDDNDPQYWQDQDDSNLTHSKHTYVVHAEKNAIYNCMLHNMTGAKLYTTQFPCNTCAQAIIQVGIKEVIYLRKKQHDSHLLINQAVDKMFNAAGITTTAYKELDVSDASFIKQLIMLGENEFN